MNIILNDSNRTLGGIEVLFIEMAEYFSNRGDKVYFIVNNDKNIYQRKLKSKKNVFFIKKYSSKPIEIFSDKDITLEKKYVLAQVPEYQKFSVISPYFHSFQYAMLVFGDDKKFKLMHLWSHPQSWVNRLELIKSNTIKKNKKKNEKYFYQQKLIKKLSQLDADYYGGRIVPVFNSWFYELDIKKTAIETLPIIDVPNKFKKIDTFKNNNCISILWCGRFTYFKDEAIIHIHKVLELLAAEYPEINIHYGIIGFGSQRSTNYVKNNIKPKEVNVNFIGKVDPNDLISVFHEYDIGIGMGLTVKKMGQVGLPAIVIDSFDPNKQHIKNSNWLFDTFEGDAGDGYYFSIAGKPIENRKKLYDLLKDIMKEPDKLTIYSKRCIEYVEENYSFEKQVHEILKIAKNSKFAGISYPIYRVKFYKRTVLNCLYKVFVKAKKLKSILINLVKNR